MATKAAIRAMQREARLNILARKATSAGYTNVKIVGTGAGAIVRGRKPGGKALSRITEESFNG